MSLMKLSPESVRLRRIAKAYAAGEFSMHEYRQARRDVIGNFTTQSMDDDDTQPRWDTPTIKLADHLQSSQHKQSGQVNQITQRKVNSPMLWLAMFALLCVAVFASRAFSATTRRSCSASSTRFAARAGEARPVASRLNRCIVLL